MDVVESINGESDQNLPISARFIQQNFYDNLGDRTWDEFKGNDVYLIKQRIAYALFGPPSQESDLESFTNNSTFGYSSEQMETVLPLYEKILNFCKYSPDGNSIYMSIIFICLVPEVPDVKNIQILDNYEYTNITTCPVFCIRKCIKPTNADDDFLGCRFFVDHIGRVYPDWNSYLENNKNGEGIIIAPFNGRYRAAIIKGDEHVKLQIVWSPASSTGAKVLRAAEIASTVVAVSTVGVVASSLIVPIGATVGAFTAVASVATGLFGLGTSSHHLHDRSKHQQPIGLGDAQARGCWINVAASGTGIVAGAASSVLSKAAGSGVVIGRGFQAAHDAAIIAAMVTSGTGILNSIFNFHEQYTRTKELPSALEIFQFTSSVLFFTNSVMSNRMATTIIKDAQTTSISDYRNTLSNKQRKIFDKMSGETRRLQGTSNGNAEIIRSTQIIGNNRDFFRDAARINKGLNENGVRISFDNGNALFNGQHVMNPSEFYAMSPVQRSAHLASLGRADLSTANAATRLTSTQVSGIGNLPVGAIVTSVIKITKLLDSFPDIAGNDEVLLQYIAQKLTTFANDSMVYECFVEIINCLASQLDNYMRMQLGVLGIDSSRLLFKLFQICYDYFIDFMGVESEIPAAIQFFFRNGRLCEDNVRGILRYMKNKIDIEYKNFKKRELKCAVCQGVTFSND